MTTLAKVFYQEIKTIALGMGLTVTDSHLWCDTAFIRTQYHQNGIQTLSREHQIVSWKALPSHVLLATKWQRKKTSVLTLDDLLAKFQPTRDHGS